VARALAFNEGPEPGEVRLILRLPVEVKREEPAPPTAEIASVGDVVLGRADPARKRAHGAKAPQQRFVGSGKPCRQALHRLRTAAR
jgi:hypothetical protein